MADSAKGDVETVELGRLAQAAARRAADAAATVPQLVAQAAAPAREDGVVLAAVAEALRAHPAVNGAYRDGRAERYSRVNLGIVLPGPVTPTIFDADTLGTLELDDRLRELVARDPEEFTAAEQAGATFTIAGLGLQGLQTVQPVIAPRQAATLGVGQEALTLVADARLLSPADAAAFLTTVTAGSGPARRHA